jgi:hypothetical protein
MNGTYVEYEKTVSYLPGRIMRDIGTTSEQTINSIIYLSDNQKLIRKTPDW